MEMTLKKITSDKLPESVYHGEQYIDYLSGSELWAYIDSCPAEYVYGDKKETKSLLTGSAVHSEILEMQIFDDIYYRGFEPTKDTLCSDEKVKARLKAIGVAGYSTKKGNELYDMLLKAEPTSEIKKVEEFKLEEAHKGKTMLSYEDYDMAKAMREQLMQYPNYSEYVLQGECESSIVGECVLFGRNVMVKTRPDIIHGRSITNYKTASSAKPSDLIRQCFNDGYLLKEVFNALVFEQMYGYFPQINILAQSKKTPYVCTMFSMTQEMIDVGMEQLHQAFDIWSQCQDSGVVIDYAQGEILTNLLIEPWMIYKAVRY